MATRVDHAQYTAGDQAVKTNLFKAKMLYHKGFHAMTHLPLHYNI